MGIFHFAGLGKSPGAVTAGLSYLKNTEGDNPEYGKIVEGVVIFTSPEIVNGKEKAYSSTDNEYMERTSSKKWTNHLENSFEIVKEFFHREFKDIEAYICEVNVNNFSECFEAIGKSLLKFHPPGQVGKHIWGNLTGGTNILNAALMQTAYLTGFIPVLYYTFVANLQKDGKYLKPFSRKETEFDFRKIYAFKTTFDERYLLILEELRERESWIKDNELLNRLRDRESRLFGDLNIEKFRRDFLNVMETCGVERKGKENLNRLSEDGKRILDIMQSPLFRALTRRNSFSSNEINELISDLQISKI